MFPLILPIAAVFGGVMAIVQAVESSKDSKKSPDTSSSSSSSARAQAPPVGQMIPAQVLVSRYIMPAGGGQSMPDTSQIGQFVF